MLSYYNNVNKHNETNKSNNSNLTTCQLQHPKTTKQQFESFLVQVFDSNMTLPNMKEQIDTFCFGNDRMPTYGAIQIKIKVNTLTPLKKDSFTT